MCVFMCLCVRVLVCVCVCACVCVRAYPLIRQVWNRRSVSWLESDTIHTHMHTIIHTQRERTQTFTHRERTQTFTRKESAHKHSHTARAHDKIQQPTC